MRRNSWPCKISKFQANRIVLLNKFLSCGSLFVSDLDCNEGKIHDNYKLPFMNFKEIANQKANESFPNLKKECMPCNSSIKTLTPDTKCPSQQGSDDTAEKIHIRACGNDYRPNRIVPVASCNMQETTFQTVNKQKYQIDGRKMKAMSWPKCRVTSPTSTDSQEANISNTTASTEKIRCKTGYDNAVKYRVCYVGENKSFLGMAVNPKPIYAASHRFSYPGHIRTASQENKYDTNLNEMYSAEDLSASSCKSNIERENISERLKFHPNLVHVENKFDSLSKEIINNGCNTVTQRMQGNLTAKVTGFRRAKGCLRNLILLHEGEIARASATYTEPKKATKIDYFLPEKPLDNSKSSNSEAQLNKESFSSFLLYTNNVPEIQDDNRQIAVNSEDSPACFSQQMCLSASSKSASTSQRNENDKSTMTDSRYSSSEIELKSNLSELIVEREEMIRKLLTENKELNQKLEDQRKVANAYQKLEDRYRKRVYELERILSNCNCCSKPTKDVSYQPRITKTFPRFV